MNNKVYSGFDFKPVVCCMNVLFFVALLDTAGFGIIIPVFLYYAQQLGASAEVGTAIFSIYPIAMMIGAPWMGRLSDRFGQLVTYPTESF